MSDLLETCTACGGLIDDEDLFCANCGREAPGRPDDAKRDESFTTTHKFGCNSCGASMSYDASAGTLQCPFCGSKRLEQQASGRTIRPHRVIPFQFDQAEATRKMRTFLGRGFWRPNDLGHRAAVRQLVGVYVPYWVFSARTHTFWTADTNHTPARARGDWFPLTGEHHSHFEGVLVGASGVLTPGETYALCPFHLEAGVQPEEVELENVTVEQFGVPRKYARPLARQSLEALERAQVDRQYVPGRSRNVKVSMRLEGQRSEPMLLPVYVMSYQYKEKRYRFLINGQTGRASGEAPVSYKKLLMVVGIVACVLLLGLLFLLGIGSLSSATEPASPQYAHLPPAQQVPWMGESQGSEQVMSEQVMSDQVMHEPAGDRYSWLCR